MKVKYISKRVFSQSIAFHRSRLKENDRSNNTLTGLHFVAIFWVGIMGRRERQWECTGPTIGATIAYLCDLLCFTRGTKTINKLLLLSDPIDSLSQAKVGNVSVIISSVLVMVTGDLSLPFTGYSLPTLPPGLPIENKSKSLAFRSDGDFVLKGGAVGMGGQHLVIIS